MRFNGDGWLEGGAHIDPTVNFDDVANSKLLIVMHYTASYEAASAIRTFHSQKKPRSSAHFVVDTGGDITQMVSVHKKAWHAGYGTYRGKPDVNSMSIGIEIVNPGYHFLKDDGRILNWRRESIQKRRLDPFPGYIEARDPWVGSCVAIWPEFPKAQLDAVERLASALVKKYASIMDIVGHRDVDTVRMLKVDPGPAFPLRRYRMLLQARNEDDRKPLEAVVVVSGTLNVRGGPGEQFEKLDWGPLQNGQFVQVLRGAGDWDYIRRWIEGEMFEGWVSSRYLVPR